MEERMQFDKFTERARKVLSLAQEEAQRFSHNYIGTEHLLLGLIREGEGTAARVLTGLGVELSKARSAVEFIIGRGDRIVLGEVGLTPRAKKVIELAVDEARRLNHHYIGTEHILLGMIREGEGIAAGVLESLGVSLEKVRIATIQVLSGQEITVSTATFGATWQGVPVKMLRPAIVVQPRDPATTEIARHLDERLVAAVGRDHVFNTTLPAPLGWDWREHLRHQIGRCNVVLVVIGPAWLPETDEQGRVRDENDLLYLGLTRALQLRQRIVPLFVYEASFAAERLPEAIRDIVFYSGMTLHAEPQLDDDITRLIETLQAMEWD